MSLSTEVGKSTSRSWLALLCGTLLAGLLLGLPPTSAGAGPKHGGGGHSSSKHGGKGHAGHQGAHAKSGKHKGHAHAAKHGSKRHQTHVAAAKRHRSAQLHRHSSGSSSRSSSGSSGGSASGRSIGSSSRGAGSNSSANSNRNASSSAHSAASGNWNHNGPAFYSHAWRRAYWGGHSWGSHYWGVGAAPAILTEEVVTRPGPHTYIVEYQKAQTSQIYAEEVRAWSKSEAREKVRKHHPDAIFTSVRLR